MVTAIVLLTVTQDRVNEVASEIAALKGVSEVYSITGAHDLAAIVRAPDNDTLADIVTAQVLKIPGVVRSETMFAFRAYSRHDLEGMFSVGLE